MDQIKLNELMKMSDKEIYTYFGKKPVAMTELKEIDFDLKRKFKKKVLDFETEGVLRYFTQ